jgi:hypothetical protein
MTEWLNGLWEAVVRLRTWLFNGIGFVFIALLPLLGAPEIMSIIPVEYQKYVIALAFVINIWMRPRPAVVKKDLEP